MQGNDLDTPTDIGLNISFHSHLYISDLSQSAQIGIQVDISFDTLLVTLLSLIAFHLYNTSQSNSPALGSVKEATLKLKKLE